MPVFEVYSGDSYLGIMEPFQGRVPGLPNSIHDRRDSQHADRGLLHRAVRVSQAMARPSSVS